MQDEIKKIGIKAYTLKLLKERGFFTKNLFVSSKLPTRKQFNKAMQESGFRQGDELSCRFSHPSKAVYLPRTIATSFEGAYKFYKKNIKKDYTILIHNLLHAKYGGTVTKINNELVLEFVEGDWNADYSLNMDTAFFSGGESTWHLYQKERMVPYVSGAHIKYKEVFPVDDNLAKKLNTNISARINLISEILSSEYNSLELLIDEDGNIQPLKLLNISSLTRHIPTKSQDEVFEIKTPHDLVRWDKKKRLLISIPANIDKADTLLGVISEIKKYTNSVYISYGILSHPAILLREAGLKVERKISNYKILKFRY